MDVDLGDLVDLEQQFYDVGYKDGIKHGRVHGLIEGRALGKEKGFEMWEEVGFYLGFAATWKSLLELQRDPNLKMIYHLSHLMELAGSFPMDNPSQSSTGTNREVDQQSSDVDISGLLSRMRGRYRVACSGLGVRPRLPSSSLMDGGSSTADLLGGSESLRQDADRGQGDNPPVWSFADASRKAGIGGMNF